MIVSNLIGGLGNQLFQYAFGFAQAARHGVELRLATDLFTDYRLHQGYELARVFAVHPKEASASDLKALLGIWRHPALRRALSRCAPGLWRAGMAAFEPASGWWPGVGRLSADAYVHGYWQSERYFAEQAIALRRSLQFRHPPSADNSRWLERIGRCVSVSVHIRGGDYVSSAKNRRIYAGCGPEYYGAALDRLCAAHSGARFFAFSDDVSWARQCLGDRLDAVEIIDLNRGTESWNDMRLMSHCQHHVIANSSFSWWGAWLGERPGTTIIAPRQWYVAPGRCLDLVPERWLRL